MSGGRVLVVDDTPFNRRLFVRLLASIGHETEEAANGGEALARLRDPAAEAVDVVLLDIIMPVMDGYETLAALKADERLREMPVIVITDIDELDSVVRCIRMGAADYLPKTVDPEILRARIEASLAQKRLRDNERELLATIDRQRSQLPRFLSPQVAAARVESRTARRCWPVTDARSPRCSATSATSPSSPSRPSPRRCSASCAPTTRRWAS